MTRSLTVDLDHVVLILFQSVTSASSENKTCPWPDLRGALHLSSWHGLFPSRRKNEINKSKIEQMKIKFFFVAVRGTKIEGFY